MKFWKISINKLTYLTMTNKSKKKQPKKFQHDLFKEVAKDHGCDNKFDLKKALKKLIKPKKS